MKEPKNTPGIAAVPGGEKGAAGLPATPHQSSNQEQNISKKYVWQYSPDPWTEYVNGQVLLDEMRKCFARYLVLPEHGASTLALWALHTYSFDLGNTSAYLALLSPEKRCGKTTALSAVSAFAHRALPASNITGAAVFRVIEK